MNLFRVIIPHLGERLSVLLLAICAIGSSLTMAEQASPLANTFLDVQVPASPMALRVGGRPQLVYELHITNFRSAVVTLSRVEVQSDPAGKALHSYEGHSGKADLQVTADSRAWLGFLAKERNLAWALLRRKIRLRGSPRLLLAFGKCFPS